MAHEFAIKLIILINVYNDVIECTKWTKKHLFELVLVTRTNSSPKPCDSSKCSSHSNGWNNTECGTNSNFFVVFVVVVFAIGAVMRFKNGIGRAFSRFSFWTKENCHSLLSKWVIYRLRHGSLPNFIRFGPFFFSPKQTWFITNRFYHSSDTQKRFAMENNRHKWIFRIDFLRFADTSSGVFRK